MGGVDIVIVKPGSQKQLYGELSAFDLTAIEPPLWAAVLAASMRDLGYSVALYDAEAENWNHEETAQRIQEIDPILAAVFVSGTNPSASTMNMSGATAILNHLNEIGPHTKTLLAGLHPSALPEQSLREETVDFVCQGETIYTLPRLVDALKADVEDFPIEGLSYRKNGGVFSNPRPSLVTDLDTLPMPAWDLLPMEKYRAHNWHCFDNIHRRQPYAVIYTSLGCPFRCSFCCVNALFGRPGIRYRSPDLVIEEIDCLVNTYGIRNIKILDEMFALKESHVVRFCDLIIDRGYDLNMWAYARVNTVTERMLGRMKKAGINWVAYGFESGDSRVLKGVSKGYDPGRLSRVVDMTYRAGLYIGANFIFGLPDDDDQSMMATLDLAKDINAEWANFYSTMAYPGSRLYEQALEEGWPLPETWHGYSQYAYEALPLPTKYLTGPEVLGFRDRAFKDYFSSPRYLDKIRITFGDEVVAYVRNMLKRDLRRKHVAAEPMEQVGLGEGAHG
jgi:radical SAM superfamily enzyme YgiQ (UPF0313 family)